MQSGIDLETLYGFLDESTDSLQDVEAAFIDLENDPGNAEIINRIFRPVHSLKGNSGFFGLTHINKFSHRMENLLDFIRRGEILMDREITDVLLSGIDVLNSMVARVYGDAEDVTFRPDEEELLLKIEQYQPVKTKGTIQSVLEFEKLLEEAIAFDLSMVENALIANLLDEIEKANPEIRKIILDSQTAQSAMPDMTNGEFFLADDNYTAPVQILLQVRDKLAEKSAIVKELITEWRTALNELIALPDTEPEMKKALEDLVAMTNFLDDELMATNDEFIRTTGNQINMLVGLFRFEPGEEIAEKKLGEILVEEGLVSGEQLEQALNSQKKVGDILIEQGALDEEKLQAALNIQGRQQMQARQQKTAKGSERGKTIRIDQNKLDLFANFVGELFINIDSFNFLNKQIESFDLDFEIMSKFSNTISSLDDVVDKLHESIMNIRRVPMKNLLQRFPRVVREIGDSLGKKISFNIHGEETIIDKDLLELIENPLVHILRNSVDHGIETPAERAAKNKPETGTLSLTVSVDENYVYLIIKDDGAGIDPQKMKDIGIKKGIISEDEAGCLSEKDLINLIFEPGLSSAEKVTDVSGRGVGMDVVMSAIRQSNGIINVDSQIDHGTTVTITIPLSTTLITKDAMIVTTGGKTIAVPSEEINCTIEVTGNYIDLMDEDNCIMHAGSIFKVVDLHAFFYQQSLQPATGKTKQVLIVCREHKIAVLVDEVISHQKIVVRSFEGGFFKQQGDIRGIGGYTILGNEDIVLIADIGKIAVRKEKITSCH